MYLRHFITLQGCFVGVGIFFRQCMYLCAYALKYQNAWYILCGAFLTEGYHTGIGTKVQACKTDIYGLE